MVKPHILLIDSNEDHSYNLTLNLEFNNFQVTPTKSWEDAIHYLTNNTKPDLIICNLCDPELNNAAIHSEILDNQILNEIPFIFLTSRTTPEVIAIARTLGAEDILFLPLKEQTLFSSIKKIFQSRGKYDFIF